MTHQQTGHLVRHCGGGQVWDPGARILIYTDNKTTVSTTGAGAGAETKEKNTKPSKQLQRFINTRASPNKSQDSGFSDSGESESSNTSETKGSDFKIKLRKLVELFNLVQKAYGSLGTAGIQIIQGKWYLNKINCWVAILKSVFRRSSCDKDIFLLQQCRKSLSEPELPPSVQYQHSERKWKT